METILKYLTVAIRYRKLILYNVLTFTLAAVIISLILPKKYTAGAQILPPSEEAELLGPLTMPGISVPLGDGKASQWIRKFLRRLLNRYKYQGLTL